MRARCIDDAPGQAMWGPLFYAADREEDHRRIAMVKNLDRGITSEFSHCAE